MRYMASISYKRGIPSPVKGSRSRLALLAVVVALPSAAAQDMYDDTDLAGLTLVQQGSERLGERGGSDWHGPGVQSGPTAPAGWELELPFF